MGTDAKIGVIDSLFNIILKLLISICRRCIVHRIYSGMCMCKYRFFPRNVTYIVPCILSDRNHPLFPLSNTLRRI